MHPKNPSLPSRKAEALLRFSRLPALRDSACWSVKWRLRPQFEWYRGYVFARLKEGFLETFFYFYCKGVINMSNQNPATQLMDIAMRIRDMRDIMGYSMHKMAELTDISE